MKFILSLLAVVFVCLGAHAAQAPFPPWLDIGGEYVAPDGSRPLALVGQESEGNYNRHVARFTYSVASDGSSSLAGVGTGVYLPAKAVITRSYFKITTQFADSGTGYTVVECEDTANLKAPTDITGSAANAFVEGAATGAASAFVRGIAASCEIKVRAQSDIPSAGAFIGWLEYSLED